MRILHVRSRLRWLIGYPSGARLDLRSVMLFESDPRHYNRIWMRKSVPKRYDLVFMLLIDLSGSMRVQMPLRHCKERC